LQLVNCGQIAHRDMVIIHNLQEMAVTLSNGSNVGAPWCTI